MRGEHFILWTRHLYKKGSSPLARGTRNVPKRRRTDSGIIPACAGNTVFRNTRSQQRQDHPRLRGEHIIERHRVPNRQGSSPLARGTPCQRCGPGRRRRIIPACAGNTLRDRIKLRHHQDHPRLRGEHVDNRRSSPPCRGSSPLARGTLLRRRILAKVGRIIPACAGNTE